MPTNIKNTFLCIRIYLLIVMISSNLNEKFWKDYLGRIPIDRTPANPRSRPLLDRPAWTGHEVQLDVAPDIFAWGYLLLPKNLRPGEHRPVVVSHPGGT